MKYVIWSIFGVLVVATVGNWLSQPDVRSDKPVLYWLTDPNPARVQQIKTFHEWLKKDPSRPDFELRVDTANFDASKMLVQGVSGVASDIIGHCGMGRMYLFEEIGLLTDVTEWGKELEFDPSYTYPSVYSEITVDGRQYSFPCNVFAHMFWINKATFARYGMETPPGRWTFEEFERIGKEFVKRANEGRDRRNVFFANTTQTAMWRRSVGLDIYNETLTRCILDDPRNVEILDMAWRWTYQDHLIPSRSERDAFATASGYGGSTLQLFNSGNYAMFQMGRYALIQLREFGKLELAVSEPPHGGFPNTETGTRAAAIYVAGKHRELAKYFLSFLASEDYNMNIVLDADALPPNPKYTETEEYKHPKDYPNEWGCHEAFSEAAIEIGIPYSNSPFVLRDSAGRIIWQTEDGVMTADRVLKPDDAAKMMAERINERIDRRVNENPALKPLYDKRVALQKRIDDLRAKGERVPLDWISNPFYRKYYVFKGWVK